MEIRYLGFDQRQNSRVYRFDVRDERQTKEVSVTADIAVFRNHSVGIQEGPILCGNKLTADLERGWEGEHELTALRGQLQRLVELLSVPSEEKAHNADQW